MCQIHPSLKKLENYISWNLFGSKMDAYSYKNLRNVYLNDSIWHFLLLKQGKPNNMALKILLSM